MRTTGRPPGLGRDMAPWESPFHPTEQEQGTICHVYACRPQGGGREAPREEHPGCWGVQKTSEGAQLACHPAREKEHLLLHPPGTGVWTLDILQCLRRKQTCLQGEGSGRWALACPGSSHTAPSRG